MSLQTPTEHERAEWRRLATAAYRIGRTDIGHKFSAAGAGLEGAQLSLSYFDELQTVYRAWLIDGTLPPAPRSAHDCQHDYRGAPADVAVTTEWGTFNVCRPCSVDLQAAGYVRESFELPTRPAPATFDEHCARILSSGQGYHPALRCECEHESHFHEAHDLTAGRFIGDGPDTREDR